MNRKIFLVLVTILYGGVCILFLASGYQVQYCFNMLGFIIGIELVLGMVLVIRQMFLSVVSESESDDELLHGLKSIKAPVWLVKFSKQIPDWVKDALDRAGTAGHIIFQLLPVFDEIILTITICTAILFGIGYIFTTTGASLVPDYLKLIGQISGLYMMFVIWTLFNQLVKETSI